MNAPVYYIVFKLVYRNLETFNRAVEDTSHYDLFDFPTDQWDPYRSFVAQARFAIFTLICTVIVAGEYTLLMKAAGLYV